MVDINTNKKIIIYKYRSLIFFVTVLVAGIATAFYLYNLESHSLYFYSDSTTHALQARRYVDSMSPGFFQHLGTVWLPLPHLLILPFTLIDPLFRTGFAGLIVGLPSHALTSLLLYKIISRHIDGTYIPFVGGFLYAFNPNFLYLALSPLTEAPFMLFFVASAFYFQKWLFSLRIFYSYKENRSKTITESNNISGSTISRCLNLLKSAIFVSLATLCRYEGWVLSISLVIIVFASFIIKRRIATRNHLKRNIILVLIIFPIFSFSGMIFWIAWNWYSYGDPLEFSNNPIYSAAGQALRGGKRDFLYLQPINVLTVYGTALVYVFGPVIILAALLGYLSSTIFSKDEDKLKRILLYLFLVIPSIFTILSMISGVGEMSLNHWFNSRFLIVLGPLMAILSCMFIAHILNKIRSSKRNRIIITLIIISLFLFQSISPLFTVVTFADAKAQFANEDRSSQLNVGQYLHQLYNGNGTIFLITTGGVESNIAIESGLSLKSFSVLRDSDSNSSKFHMPWLYANNLVLSKQPKEENKYVANYWKSRQDTLGEFYNKVYEDKNYIIFSIKNGERSSCINYNSFTQIISVTCASSNLTDVYNKLSKFKVLLKEPSKSWLLDANLEIGNKSTFYINSTDTEWLKFNSTDRHAHSINAHGNLTIDSVKITGWDTKLNDFARTDINGTTARSFILVNHGPGITNINNSEIAYLGYNNKDSFGLTYHTGSGSTISNNKIHDLHFGFYSQDKSYNMAIENNKFYNNSGYGIDPHSGTNLTIRHNEVFGNGKHGIICSTDCYNVRIESNHVFNNTNEGIMLYKNVTNSVIKNNLLSGNRDQIAIYDSSNKNLIFNNSVTGGKVGIRLNTGSSENMVRGNTMANSNYGIYLLQGASNNVIDSNIVINSSEFPIYIQGNDTKNNIFENNVLLHNNKTYGNVSDLESKQNLFVNNTVQYTMK